MSITLALLLAHAAPGAHVVHVEKSPYTTVYVVDDGDRRLLRFDAADGDDQSEISLANPEAVPMEYVRVAAAGLAFVKHPDRALIIGAGGGTFPMLLRRHLPKMRVDAVDIDPVVLNISQKYFGVKADDHLALFAQDGAAFVAESRARYDLVLLDAYSGTGIPAHLTTPAFLEVVRAHVSPGGVVVANVALDDANVSSAFIATFARTFVTCRALRGHEAGNVVLVGTTAPLPSAIERPLKDATWTYHLPFELADVVESSAPCG